MRFFRVCGETGFTGNANSLGKTQICVPLLPPDGVAASRGEQANFEKTRQNVVIESGHSPQSSTRQKSVVKTAADETLAIRNEGRWKQ
jgi:predicted nucleotide-binding protein